MKFNKISALLLACLFSASINQLPAQESSQKEKTIIYKFDIKKEIAPPVWHTTRKALLEAKELKADVILIHMNTYGGMLESADSIRTAILQSEIPVWVF
ncbi:MAG: serine protease, partial [Bacteroidetes bacterium HGW-Bacteroidetes-9]